MHKWWQWEERTDLRAILKWSSLGQQQISSFRATFMPDAKTRARKMNAMAINERTAFIKKAADVEYRDLPDAYSTCIYDEIEALTQPGIHDTMIWKEAVEAMSQAAEHQPSPVASERSET